MAEREFGKGRDIFQLHRNYWENLPSIVLRAKVDYTRDPLRMQIYAGNIKGDYSAERLDIEKLVDDTKRAYQDRSVVNGDVFECVQLACVIPWMEAITGCRIYALGKGASMVANPPDIEPVKLAQHLRHLLDNLEENAWFKKLINGYKGLAEVLGPKYPIAHTLMRGPGDMVGALLGHENLVWRMLKPAENRDFLNELLDLCAKIYTKAARMQLEQGREFEGGYVNEFGVWAPGLNVRTQEDEASLMSPKLYNEFLLPYHIQEVDDFDYSTFHMHTGYVMTVYNWRGLSKRSNIKAFEVDLDPSGPTVENLMETMIEINSEKPLVIDSVNEEQAKAIEEHISDFPGSVLHRALDIAKISL